MYAKALLIIVMFFVIMLSGNAYAITYKSINLSCNNTATIEPSCEYSFDGNNETTMTGVGGWGGADNLTYLYWNFSINYSVTNLTFRMIQATNGYILTFDCFSGGTWITWKTNVYPILIGYLDELFYPPLSCVDYAHNMIQYRIMIFMDDFESEGGSIYEVTSLYDISSVFSPYNCTVKDANPTFSCNSVMDRDNETSRVIQDYGSPPDNALQVTYNFSAPQYVWSADAIIYFESNDPIQGLQINWSCRKADGTYYAFNNQTNISTDTSTVNVPSDCFIGYSNASINLSILNLGTGDTILFDEINMVATIGNSIPPAPPAPPTAQNKAVDLASIALTAIVLYLMMIIMLNKLNIGTEFMSRNFWIVNVIIAMILILIILTMI